MIGFDLDGVLLPDFDYLEDYPEQTDFYNMLINVRALFQPNIPYTIITARDPKYRRLTSLWATKQLNKQPKDLIQSKYHSETPAEYKARILNLMPHIKQYIESDPVIVKEMKPLVKWCEVIYFNDYINSSLLKTYQE